MPYVPFYLVCPETAESETRTIIIQQYDNEFNLPAGYYDFIELFCDECDCRRVFLQVFMNQKRVASIAYGWGKLSFYKKEFKGLDENELKEFKGPSLDPFQVQSHLSDGILQMFKKLLFTDKEYMDRIQRHYRQFKMQLKTREINDEF